jgi:hypothetical protein
VAAELKALRKGLGVVGVHARELNADEVMEWERRRVGETNHAASSASVVLSSEALPCPQVVCSVHASSSSPSSTFLTCSWVVLGDAGLPASSELAKSRFGGI